MFDWLRKMFGTSNPHREEQRNGDEEFSHRNPLAKLPPARPEVSATRLRAVPGALVARNQGGAVAYNMLTPHMQQFMGRCVSAIKRAGLGAKGTGQFSVLVGDHCVELRLDQFYQPSDDPAVVEQVVAEAQRIAGV